MADIDASPTDIRKLAATLAAFKRDVNQAARRVHGALNAAHWNDSRKTQFETSYIDMRKRLDSFMDDEVDEMVRRLNQLAAKLEDIKNTRM